MHWSRSLAIVLVLLGLAPVLVALAQKDKVEIYPPAAESVPPAPAEIIPPVPVIVPSIPEIVAQAPETVPPAGRDVTPPGITPGPAAEGPLMREPAPPPPPEPAEWRRFFLPKTLDAATFEAEGKTIRIAGVTPPKADAACPRQDGSNWPCGRSALHAIRMFLGGRAVECYFPHADTAIEITAPCRVGKTDLGLWLLDAGWAKPGDYATADYMKAAKTAHCNRRGLWHDEAPASACQQASSG